MLGQERRAVIDIGTNSVKLLVAEVAGHKVNPLFEGSEQTRLGEGFYLRRRLQRQPVARTAAAVARFTRTAAEWQATSLKAIATSAARDARNPGALVRAVKRASGMTIEIITGKQEAEWAFQGVTTDPRLAKRPLMLLDVGGGSTEFILGHGSHMDFRHSFPLGTVRLLEKFPPRDPPKKTELAQVRKWLRNFLTKQVKDSLSAEVRFEAGYAPKPGRVLLVGTGGTASILARMQARMEGFDRSRLERTRLARAAVQAHAEMLWRLPLAKRQKVVGLPPNRADVMLMGVLIYEAVMEEFCFKEMQVSTRGLRFAAVMAEA